MNQSHIILYLPFIIVLISHNFRSWLRFIKHRATQSEHRWASVDTTSLNVGHSDTRYTDALLTCSHGAGPKVTPPLVVVIQLWCCSGFFLYASPAALERHSVTSLTHIPGYSCFINLSCQVLCAVGWVRGFPHHFNTLCNKIYLAYLSACIGFVSF
jgi:hypothetical protein